MAAIISWLTTTPNTIEHNEAITAFYSTRNENCDAFPDADSAMVAKLSDLLSAGNGGNVPCLTATHTGSAEERLVLCTIRDVTGMFFGSSYSLVSCKIKLVVTQSNTTNKNTVSVIFEMHESELWMKELISERPSRLCTQLE